MGADPSTSDSGGSVRTFLIADVRGYTNYTQSFGDAAAAELTRRFAEVATATVTTHGGVLVEIRGDEILAVFNSTRSALRASVELQRALRSADDGREPLALGVGMGLDSGEAVPHEGGYRGAALNLAARLCGIAAPGEILASEGVAHLAGRIDGLRVAPRRPVRLKGLDEPVRAVTITPEEPLPPLPALNLPRGTSTTKRNKRVIAALAVLTALTLATVVVTSLRGPQGLAAIAPDAAGVIDVASGEIVGEVPIEGRPGGLAIGLGAVWLADSEHGALLKLDPEAHTTTDSIPVGAHPLGVAVGDGAVWVVNGDDRRVSRVDPGTGQEVASIQVGNGPREIAFGAGSLWVTNATDGTVSRIDPAANRVSETIALGQTPSGIAVGLGAVWVTSEATGLLLRIDPDDASVAGSIPVGNGPTGIALGAGAVWIANGPDRTISRVDPEDSSVRKIDVGGSPSALAFGSGALWAASGSNSSVLSIDPQDRSVTRSLGIGSSPLAVAAGDGRLWVTASPPPEAHRGGTLRVVSRGGDEFDAIDPGVSFREAAWQVLSMVYDGLVTLRRTGGSAGATIVPDLAVALPEVQDGGRTYVFRLREGVRYSTGEAVRPEDVRASVERLFRSPNEAGAQLIASNLVGSEGCFQKPRECDLSQGIAVDSEDGTVTFHLTSPDPDLLYKLALPFGSVLPADAPEADYDSAPLPSTGPYRIESYRPNGLIELVRNPHFREWSSEAQPQGFPDGITVRLGIDPDRQTSLVAKSKADVMLDTPPRSRLDEIATSYPGQAHASVRSLVYYLVPNTKAPPFDSLEARIALNLAVDRSKFVRLFGGPRLAETTCQVLPPNFPGYRPYCPYTRNSDPAGEWKAPRLERARALVDRSGTRGARVRVWTNTGDSPFEEPLARPIADLLVRLGYRPQVKVFRDAFEYYERVGGDGGDSPDLGVGGWAADFPAASNFFQLLTCANDVPERPFNQNPGHFCDPQLDRKIARARRLQTANPALANAQWQEIDRDVVDQGAWVPLLNPVDIDFLSERVGNYQRHPSPQFGVLLSQLWVQ